MHGLLRLLLCFTLLSCAAHGAGAADRIVRVGVYQNAPKIFTDANGRADGIMVDLLRNIAEAENWQLAFVVCEWSDCLEAVERGDIDLLPDVAWSVERNQVLDFHNIPALHSWSQVYRHPRVPIASILDLD